MGRHPVLATVLWLLGGSVEDGDKENKHGPGQGSSSTTSSSSSSNYHRQQARRQAEYRKEQQQQPQGRGQGSPDGHVRRLRWNAHHGAPGGSPPEANANDRIVYYVDRNGPVRDVACVLAALARLSSTVLAGSLVDCVT